MNSSKRSLQDQKHPLKVLLINNHQTNSGIGRYAHSLYPLLRELIGEDVGFYDCSSKSLDAMFHRTYGRPLSFFAGETMRTLALAKSMLMAPRAQLYHFANPVLYALSPFLRPQIVTVHDLKLSILTRRVISDYVIGALLRKLKDADMIICVSSFTAKIAMDRFDLSPSKISVIPLGIDHDKFRVRDKREARRLLGLSEAAKIIIHVGSDEERKNVPAVFRIFQMVKKEVPETILLRIGATNSAFPPVELAKYVRFVHPRDDMLPYYYNSADVLVFPSLLEGFGIPLIEAMASGTPIVTSETSSIPEVVGDSALAFEPQDEVSMADSAIQLLTDMKYALKLAQRGLERSKNFSWKICAARTREAYSKVLGN
jgi:glycosyltransferase involved in cell wall biosynthesis